MAKKVDNLQTKLIRYIKAPFRVLSKLRDIYIHNMINFAGHASYGGSAMGCPAPYGLPKAKSFSINNNSMIRSTNINDDYSEFIRAASTRTAGIINRRQQKSYAVGSIVKRSLTVGIGRIDEDKTCDFRDDFFFIRSRSYAAVTKRNNFYSKVELEPMTPLLDGTTSTSTLCQR